MLGPVPTHEQSILGVIFRALHIHIYSPDRNIIQLLMSGGSTQLMPCDLRGEKDAVLWEDDGLYRESTAELALARSRNSILQMGVSE